MENLLRRERRFEDVEMRALEKSRAREGKGGSDGIRNGMRIGG